jgi:hypothetical protein
MTVSPPDDGNGLETKAADRRAHARRAIAPRLYVILDGSNSDGILNDVSESGAALDIVGPKPEGEYVLVDFEMSEIGQHFEAKGRITWRDETGKRVGVHFVDLPAIARDQIRDWLSIKAATAEPVQPAVVQDAERDALSAPQRMLPRDVLREQEATPRIATASVRKEEASGDAELRPESEAQADQQDGRGERLVQNLLDSFNKPQKKPSFKFGNIILEKQDFLSRQRIRRLLGVAAAAGLAVLLALGVAARRSPERNTGTISVSKVGQRPNAESEEARFKREANSGGNNGAGGNGGQAGSGGGGDSGQPPANSNPRPPSLFSSLPPALAASLPKGHRYPCADLGPPGDKIRIYLWTEKDTPEAIIATYSKYLQAVSDIRLVDQAPYDLVLYVNGANVDTKGPGPGFIWSSRAFRPWYCGQALGLLEQTQVNESLHYVQGTNLDQRIQAEVAYLILHTFESIRNEHTK